ncbi:MAG: sulfatase-like hydrolase/transferase [Planctomycetota bacterium]
MRVLGSLPNSAAGGYGRGARSPGCCGVWFCWAVVGLAATVAGGCKQGDESRSALPNVVLITLDTLRADHLACYGYFRDTSPVMDAFAEESLFFERCLAPMATTLPSHTSLLTGTYPLEHGILANVDHGGMQFSPSAELRSLAEVARTAAFVSAAPVKKATGMASGFETFSEPEGPTRRAGRTNALLFPWLDEHQDEPFFLWMHYFDPHSPYSAPPPFRTMYHTDERLESYLTERRFAERVITHTKRLVQPRPAINLYDGEIRYLDTQLGRLLDRLRTSGAWDRTIVVLVGDHGEGLCQHQEARHGSIWGEQLHVPLMLRIPGHAPRRVSEAMSLVDVFPTDLVDALPFDDFLKQTSGTAALSEHFQPRPVFSQDVGRPHLGRAGPRYALTTRDWKYVHDPHGDEHLYHLQRDPFELENVLAEHAEIGEQLKSQLLGQLAEQTEKAARLQTGASEAKVRMDPQLLEELRTLGYVGD